MNASLLVFLLSCCGGLPVEPATFPPSVQVVQAPAPAAQARAKAALALSCAADCTAAVARMAPVNSARCSAACTCGCNQGQACTCGGTATQVDRASYSVYYVSEPPDVQYFSESSARPQRVRHFFQRFRQRRGGCRSGGCGPGG